MPNVDGGGGTVSQIMTVEMTLGSGFFAYLRSQPMMTSFMNVPLFTEFLFIEDPNTRGSPKIKPKLR